MSAQLHILRAGPLTTLQDAGRPGFLSAGVSASGPMDRRAFFRAGHWLGQAAEAGIEFTFTGLELQVEDGPLGIAGDGGDFTVSVNGTEKPWPMRALLHVGDRLEIRPGASGNYGYLRFDRPIDLPKVMTSLATNTVVGIGGIAGRALAAGDIMPLGARIARRADARPVPEAVETAPMRIIWGLHADRFPASTRNRFTTEAFKVSTRIDRMGARLDDPNRVFADTAMLSLVSDAIVPGDIQILGDGTPVVLLRDHQPTGGYPRIATVISADLDRFVQLRPGSEVRFEAVTVARAHTLRGGQV